MSKKLVDDVLETPVAYSLDQQRANIVHMLAKPGHKPCSGSGIIGWRNGGKVAILCICVKKRATLLEPKLEQAQRQLRARILHEKRWTTRVVRWFAARLSSLKQRLRARRERLLVERQLSTRP